MTAPAKRYPKGQVTPHGLYHITHGTRPMMWLKAWDGSIHYDLLGGLAPPFHDPTEPECVALHSIKGLIAPVRHITQKGATQDGVTHVDSLYDPTEIEVELECAAGDQLGILRVVSDLYASIDAIKTSELGWWTKDLGYWWSDIRWLKGGNPNVLQGVQQLRQKVSMRWQADTGFWRSHEHTGSFGFIYEDFTDTFAYDTEDDGDLGADWPLHYDEPGGGFIYADGSQARWMDDPDDWLLTETREVVAGPYKDFETVTDDQVVTMVMGSLQEWSLPEGAANDLWARMGRNPDGSWDGNGIRVRMENNILKLSRFNGFSQTVMKQRLMLIPPLFGEKFTLIAGTDGNPRMFKVLRNGAEILSHKESGTGSMRGPDYRGVGFGMQAGAALITQATPASVRKISAGDNAMVTQSGFVEMVNVGDQPMYWDATLFGPFQKVRLYDGPGSTEYVEFGPLLPNQIVFLRTDPRSNTTLVQDLTVVPPSPQELNTFQSAISKFLDWVGPDSSALEDQIKSLFGIRPPQGNFYQYLNGRFSDACAIPPKSPGYPAQTYHLKVEILGGNADSKVILAGTPLRRYPL